MVRNRIAFTCCVVFAVAVCVLPAAAGERPIRKLSYDESAPVVALFDGIDDGQLQVKVSPKSAQESTVSIKNLTDAPLTVALPKAAVGVHILPQFQQQQPGFFNPSGNNFNGPQNQNQNQNQFGQSQSVGGIFQPLGNQSQGFPNQGNGLNNQFPGNNFFSIPPEKTVQIKLKTVCLNYGWPDPLPGMKYELRSVDTQISNPALRQLLENYSPRVNDQAMQAAAWRLANGLTWDQLAGVPSLNVIGARMFDGPTLSAAQNLVQAAEKAAEKADGEALPQAAPAAAKLTSTRTK